MIAIAKKVDLLPMLKAMEYIAAYDFGKLVTSMNTYFQQTTATSPLQVEGVMGEVLWKVDTPAGVMVVGGWGSNVYEGSFAFIVDLGGNDLYRGLSTLTGGANPLSIVVDGVEMTAIRIPK